MVGKGYFGVGDRGELVEAEGAAFAEFKGGLSFLMKVVEGVEKVLGRVIREFYNALRKATM